MADHPIIDHPEAPTFAVDGSNPNKLANVRAWMDEAGRAKSTPVKEPSARVEVTLLDGRARLRVMVDYCVYERNDKIIGTQCDLVFVDVPLDKLTEWIGEIKAELDKRSN